MLRKKKSKRGIIDEYVPEVPEDQAKRQVIYGSVGFILSFILVLLFRPGSDHLLEMIVLIGFVASSTLGGMKMANWIDSRQYKLKG